MWCLGGWRRRVIGCPAIVISWRKFRIKFNDTFAMDLAYTRYCLNMGISPDRCL